MTSQGILNYAELDSERFGIRVERANLSANTPASVAVDAIRASSADLIIARVPAGMFSVPVALLQQGESLIHADTLVYYSTELPTPFGRLAPNVRKAGVADLSAIHDIAGAAFRNYRAHYAANPLLPPEKVLDGYIEWAQSRATASNPYSDTWMVLDAAIPAGFATCDIQRDSVEIVLNAVHPDFERRGHYGTLLRHLIQHYSEEGLANLKISTQIWNYTVQRQWTRAGLVLASAHDTFHIDRRLGPNRSNP